MYMYKVAVSTYQYNHAMLGIQLNVVDLGRVKISNKTGHTFY